MCCCKTILGNLKVLRAATSRIGKEYAARGSNSTTAQEAKDLLVEGMAELEQLYEHSVTTSHIVLFYVIYCIPLG
jgi:hypothetical protein